MFGYVRPLREELKVRDLDLYRATYCGLCRTLRRRCGFSASLLLNFDFTFLAILLAPKDGEQLTCSHRCHIVPVRRCMCEQSEALERAADTSVILAWWRLRDSVLDDGWLHGLSARFACLFVRRAYRRASARLPEFDRIVRRQLDLLHALERERCASVDRAADTFAVLLQAAVPLCGDACTDRAVQQLIYHLGRWIYLIDARDDLEADKLDGSYNPILLRWGAEDGDVELAATLNHSLNLMRSACALLDLGRQETLVKNVLNHGLPFVQRAVFDGTWKQIKKRKIWRGKI